MKRGTLLSFGGIAVLAACACGTSTQLSRLAGSYGSSMSSHVIHPLFVVVGAALLLAGMAQRGRAAGLLAMGAVTSLLVAEKLLPVMGIDAKTQLNGAQLSGVALYLTGGALLVAALWAAFPVRARGYGLAAYAGLAASVGCYCCLVSQGISGVAHIVAPSVTWLGSSLFIYSVATVLMAMGLYKIGGVVPAVVMIVGHAIDFAGLELPYSEVPAVTVHGVPLGFVSKYPMMLAGTLIMAGAFVMALAAEYRRYPRAKPLSFARESEPMMAGD